MAIEEPKPTQVQIEGLNLRNVFDDRFIGALEKAIGRTPYYITVRLIDLDDDKGEIISLFHENKEKSDQNLLNIDTSDPKTLSKVVKAVIKYYEGYEDDRSE